MAGRAESALVMTQNFKLSPKKKKKMVIIIEEPFSPQPLPKERIS
jgi:hypothetical protein